jgi:hypothetical protein
LETSLKWLYRESALPGKLSGPYTELSAAFEIVPFFTRFASYKYAAGNELVRENGWV